MRTRRPLREGAPTRLRKAAAAASAEKSSDKATPSANAMRIAAAITIKGSISIRVNISIKSRGNIMQISTVPALVKIVTQNPVQICNDFRRFERRFATARARRAKLSPLPQQ